MKTKILALIIGFLAIAMFTYAVDDVVKKDTGVNVTSTTPAVKDSVKTDVKAVEATADPSIWSYLIGDYTTNQFIAMFIWAFLGMAFTLLIGTTTRKPNSANSPVPFKWGYLLQDNWKRICVSLIVIYASFLFATQLFGIEITDSNCTWIAFCIGVCVDAIVGIVKAKTNIFGTKTPAAAAPVADTPAPAPTDAPPAP